MFLDMTVQMSDVCALKYGIIYVSALVTIDLICQVR